MPTTAVEQDSRRVRRSRVRRETSPPAARREKPVGNGRLHFLGAFLREPFTVGACWPSSPALSRLMVNGKVFKPGDTVVELGPGSGAFTELILQQLRGRGRFVAVEINAHNARVLKQRFPACEVVRDSAEHLRTYVTRKSANAIISGLAWGNMMPELQDRLLGAILDSLAPGGVFTTFAYVHALWFPTSLRFRRRMFREFGRVETTQVVWRNLPPAFVYRCWR